MSFKNINNSFSDIVVTSRLENINSFLKQLDTIIDFDKLRPILKKNGIGTKNMCGIKVYDNVFDSLPCDKYHKLSFTLI